MKLRSVHFRNFRLLHDVSFDFSTSPARPLTVIRAMNESGKTTMLNAMQWALFGEDALPGEGRNYRMSPIDWDIPSNNNVTIQVELVVEDTVALPSGSVRTDIFTVTRRVVETLSATGTWQRAADSLQMHLRTERGIELEKNPELRLNRMLGSNLKDIFFTDGDRALTFINSQFSPNEKRKKVTKAIRDMLDFDILDNARQHLEKARTEIRWSVQGMPGAEKVQEQAVLVGQLETDIKDLQTRLAEIDSELRQALDTVEANELKLVRLRSKGDADQLKAALDGKRGQLQQARGSLDSRSIEQADLLSDDGLAPLLIMPYIERAAAMLADLKRAGQIPRVMIPALEDLLKNERCVCGTKLVEGHEAYKHICDLIARQQDFSAVDERLNSLRLTSSRLADLQESHAATWTARLTAAVRNRGDVEALIEKLEYEVKDLERQVTEVTSTQADVVHIQEIYSRAKAANERLVGEKARDGLLLQQKQDARQTAEEKRKNLAKRNERLTRIESRLTATEDMHAVLESSYDSIVRDELPLISAAMNTYFLEMIGADPEQRAVITGAWISADHEIRVNGPDGRHLDPDRDLNGASQRALTVAFVLALTRCSGVNAPLVIDTPLGMMSGYVKRSVLQHIIDYSHQPILFLTRDEIRGCEEILARSAGAEVTLSNSTHYNAPGGLVHWPQTNMREIVSCTCRHDQYCDLCERQGDADHNEFGLSRRVEHKAVS